MLAPDPVEALFSHAKRDDDVYVVAVIAVRRIAQGGQNFAAAVRV